MTIANFTRDISGWSTYAFAASKNCYSAVLAANTDTTLIVPSIPPMGNSTMNGTALPNILAYITITPDSSVWFAVNAAASTASGASFSSVTSQLIPDNTIKLFVKGADVIHFKTTAANVAVSVAFYSLD